MLELLKILKLIAADVSNFIDKIPFRFCKGQENTVHIISCFPWDSGRKIRWDSVYHGATCEPVI